MTESELNKIAESEFKNLICPSCNEIVPIKIGDRSLPHHFRDERANATKGCKEFMSKLNEFLSQLRRDELLPKDLSKLLKPYKQQ